MDKLYEKLFKIQELNISVTTDWENTFFKTAWWKPSKYTTLENLLKVIHPILKRNKLLLYHRCFWWSLITTIVDIDSHESITSEFQLTNTDPQKQWSSITYAKRYNISALFNITTEKDDDWNKWSWTGKKVFDEKKLEWLKKRSVWKSKWEVMQYVLKIQKEYKVSEEEKESLDLFLTTLQ